MNIVRFNFRVPLSVFLSFFCVFLDPVDAKEKERDKEGQGETSQVVEELESGANSTVEWNGNSGDSKWTNEGNWTRGSPTQYTDVKIDNGGTAVLGDGERGFYK